tara:strand:+ start:2966 stop:4204 length:1239 start_codon:yes stop_codon:yes gene_type:complete
MAGNTRTRIISQSKAVYASPTGILGPTTAQAGLSGYIPDQLHRIDTFSFNIDLAGARTDIREFGQLARIGVITMSEVSPTFNFGYYLGDGENEARLGFNIEGITGTTALNGTGANQFTKGFQTEDNNKKEKNLYVLTVKEGEDAFAAGSDFSGQRTNHDVVSFGNCTFNNYTASFAVGEIPRVDIEGVADNVLFNTGQSSGLPNPSLDLTGAPADTGEYRLDLPSTGEMDLLVLRPDDVTLTFSNGDFDIGGTKFDEMHVQSASIEVPLSRTPIEALGAERAVARPVDYPIDVTLSCSAIMRTINDGRLDMILTGLGDQNTTDIELKVDRNAGGVRNRWRLQNAVLDSQDFGLGLEDNETVDLVFSCQLGGATQIKDGLFYTGYFAHNKDANDKRSYTNVDSIVDSGHVYKK